MEKSERPNVKPTVTNIDKAIEVIAFTALIALWIFVYKVYLVLPEIIPIHFDGAGKADGYGGKATVFLAAGICTVLFAGMTFLQGKVRHFNFLTEITPENALKQYTIAVKMVRMLKLSVVMVFGLLEFHTYKATFGIGDKASQLYILGVLALVYVPLFYFLIQSSKNS